MKGSTHLYHCITKNNIEKNLKIKDLENLKI